MRLSKIEEFSLHLGLIVLHYVLLIDLSTLSSNLWKTNRKEVITVDFDILLNLGFSTEVEAIEPGLCPICSIVILQQEFKDELARKEFKISGMCQSCQDSIFLTD